MSKTLLTAVLVLSALLGAEAQVSVQVPEQVNVELRMKNASIDSSKIDGYRIQIAFSNDMNEVRKAQHKYAVEFADHKDGSYMIYQQPYWKLRIGDFYREIDAQKMLAEVREVFPKAFVVKDHIQRPPL